MNDEIPDTFPRGIAPEKPQTGLVVGTKVFTGFNDDGEAISSIAVKMPDGAVITVQAPMSDPLPEIGESVKVYRNIADDIHGFPVPATLSA